MATKPFKIRDGATLTVTPCPRCGNAREFAAHSMQVAEDLCTVWVVCRCGYDPTEGDTLYRLEDVWGTLDHGTIWAALGVWDERIAGATPQEATDG